MINLRKVKRYWGTYVNTQDSDSTQKKGILSFERNSIRYDAESSFEVGISLSSIPVELTSVLVRSHNIDHVKVFHQN